MAEATNSLVKVASGIHGISDRAKEIRGEGFRLRLALAIAGFVVGPLIAIALMKLSGERS